MRVAVGLPLLTGDWARTTEFVIEAERLGVDGVWSAEAWGYDAVTPLAFLAARTTRIQLGTGIMQAGTRTPALVASFPRPAVDRQPPLFELGKLRSG